MGLDRLGFLFIIIILPIALVLNAYTNTQVDTLKLQMEYDTKLNNSTADAVRTYQNLSINEDASNLGDVRIANINAAINVFFTSLSSNLNMAGYSKEFLQEYVPALVFTMYDGYYIFSKYTNALDEGDYATQDEVDKKNQENHYNEGNPAYVYPSTYFGEHTEGGKTVSQQLYGLKPFIHYSCRYRANDKNGVANNDVVISYTLDNYITVQGILDGNPVDKSGYLIDIDVNKWEGISYNASTKEATVSDTLKYKGIEIKKEDILTDNLVLETEDGSKPETKAYKYHKVNGVKYYWDEEKGYWFSMLNGQKNDTHYQFELTEDDSAYNYYVKAYEFSNWVNNTNLKNLTSNNAQVDYEVYNEDGSSTHSKKGLTKNSNKIFAMSGIEEPGSNFNEHRREVIKYTIEKNLSIAIANYNNYASTPGFEFRMPEFSEAEWDRIQQNMTVISYLQGLPIGTKIYNGVSVVPNNVNEEVVSEQSIYIGDGGNTTGPDETGNYYYSLLTDFSCNNTPVGIYNVDLKKREVEYNKQKYYYYPKLYYTTEVEKINIDAETTDTTKKRYAYNNNLFTYLDNNADNSVKAAFYTALGREREGRYNQRNNYENLLTEGNSQFRSYEGVQSGVVLNQLIDEAVKYNADPNNTNKVIIRNGSRPLPGSLENSSIGTRVLTDVATNTYNGLGTGASGNYVVAGGVGTLSANPNSNYMVRCYYESNGSIKAIFVKETNTEVDQYNYQFTFYEGTVSGQYIKGKDVLELMKKTAKHNKENYSSTDKTRCIVIRAGTLPSQNDSYLNDNRSSNILSDLGATRLNDWTKENDTRK